MAPARTPRRAKEERDYGNVGVKGRKTGVTLKDTGIRDEHGLEPIDGIFSSPEKSPVKQNGFTQQSTITEDDSMDIGSSTIPDPTDVLRGSRNGKILIPPRSRSPIKTNLGSSPRRSLGPGSSPSRFSNKGTPTRTIPRPSNESILDVSRDELTPSTEGSAEKVRSSQLKRVKKPMPKGRGTKRAFDLSLADEDDDDEPEPSAVNGVNGNRGIINDDSLFLNDDETSRTSPNGFGEPTEINLIQHETENVQVESPEPEVSPGVQSVKKRRVGRRPSAIPEPAHPSAFTNFSPPAQPMDPDDSQVSPTPKTQAGRGRPKGSKFIKSGKRLLDQQAETLQVLEQTSNEEPPINKGKGRKTVMSQRDANAKMKPPARPREKSVQARLTAAQSGLSRANSRNLIVSRSETPAEDSGARTTRAGRTVLRPIAYWRGERIVYGDGNVEGSTITLPGIKEVIRTEEVNLSMPKRSSRRYRPKSRLQDVADEEEDEEQQEWETETGIVRAQVLQWDPTTGKYDEDNTEEAEVAFAATAIEMRDIGGSDFRFAKTLTLPFFGSGMVDLPPGGAKRVKNSRKMQLVFFVFYGRVTVDMGTPTSSFSIGKGGMWQVPRGNFYSITNHSATRSARIFFAQGCEVAPDMTYDESQAA